MLAAAADCLFIMCSRQKVCKEGENEKFMGKIVSWENKTLDRLDGGHSIKRVCEWECLFAALHSASQYQEKGLIKDGEICVVLNIK